MTVTDEGVEVTPDTEENENEEDHEGRGRKRDRDFSKFTEQHREFAEFVNAHSGLPEQATPALVKAIQNLRSDFNDTPEQAAKREQRKQAREAEKLRYAGMTDEQIKQAKAAERVEKQAAKLQARLEEALAKAQAIREGKEASGEDIAAAVQAQQNGAEEGSGRRRFGRNR